MSDRHGQGRPGIATVAAVVLIGMAGVVFVALTGLTRQDIRRTQRTIDDAQLRQLLLAGEGVARARLAETAEGKRAGADVPLPAELRAAGATLRVTLTLGRSPNGDDASAVVEAQVGSRAGSQTLRYRQRGATWELSTATLSPVTPAVPLARPEASP